VIAYFDTSAFVPLLVEEPSTDEAARLWDLADRVAAARLIYAEARAALAQAHRMGRLDPSQHRATVRQLEERYEELDRIEVDDGLVRRAGELAEACALRGYDAVHLAAAERLHDAETVLVAGDRDLCEAARSLGLAVSELRRG
jgi:hypothetical protein